nr:putative membrane protein [uncultured bacterium]
MVDAWISVLRLWYAAGITGTGRCRLYSGSVHTVLHHPYGWCGVAVSGPVQQMLTPPSSTGELVVNISNRFQFARLGSQFVSFLILSFNQLTGILGYLVLMIIGLVMNTLGSLHLRQIPCRQVIEYKKGRNLFGTFMRTMKDRERAITLVVKWHTLAIGILLAFTIPFLRKIVGIPSNVIFLYTLTGTVAAIAAGYAVKPFADRIGSRPIMTLFSGLVILACGVWAVIPETLPKWVFFGLGFLTTFVLAIVSLLVSRLELRSIPEKDKVGYTSMINFFSAVISLVIGLSGGMLADLGEQIGFPGLNPFGLTFCVAAILAMQNAVLCIFLRDPGSLSVKETAELLFSTRNLKTFLDVYQLNMTEDRAKRTFILMSLGKSDATVAVEEMHHILHSPLASEKEEVLKTLFVHPKPALLPDLLCEATQPSSYYRATAIFALGAYPDLQVEEVLLQMLNDPSPLIQSTAAKSLARIGNTTALPRIRSLAAEPLLGVTEQMNYLIAISLMDTEGAYLERLFQIADNSKGEVFEQTMLALASRMLNFEPVLADLFQDENTEPTSGLQQLFDEAKQLAPFFEHHDNLVKSYTERRYQTIWGWCRHTLEAHHVNGRFGHLKRAITTPPDHLNSSNSFAVLYFTYQILQQTPPSDGASDAPVMHRP